MFLWTRKMQFSQQIFQKKIEKNLLEKVEIKNKQLHFFPFGHQLFSLFWFPGTRNNKFLLEHLWSLHTKKNKKSNDFAGF